MVDACDPDADIENLRQLIKLNTGVNIKLTRNEICQAYNEIQAGKLPLPPMVMTSDRTYLIDKKSPLKERDYEALFNSATKRADLKRIARKVDLKRVEQMTKSQIVDAIGKRLRYMKVHEPVKFATRRQVAINRNAAVNNTAVNNVNFGGNIPNNGGGNIVNNGGGNIFNNGGGGNIPNNGGGGGNVFNNGGGGNIPNNGGGNVFNNGGGVNVENRPRNQTSKITFPSGGLFMKGSKPKFLGGITPSVVTSSTKTTQPKKGLFARLFGKKNVNIPNRPVRPVNIPNRPVRPVNIPNGPVRPVRPMGPVNILNGPVRPMGPVRPVRPMGPVNIPNGPMGPVRPMGPVNIPNEPMGPVNIPNGPVNIPNGPVNIPNGPMGPVNIPNEPVNIPNEPMGPVNIPNNVTKIKEKKMITFLETVQLNKLNKNRFINRVRQPGSNVNALISEAKQLVNKRAIIKKQENAKRNANEKRKARNAMTKNVATKLQSLTDLERENRKIFMNRLPTNGPQKVLNNATALNRERKAQREQKRLEENAKKKAEENAKRNANEKRKARNAMTKNVATKLQSLTDLERENRKIFMNRLPTNGPQKVLNNATALNRERKAQREQKRLEENAKKAEENAKRNAEEKRKARNAMTKNVATKLQSLTDLERENRKIFMNRLSTNGPQKVLNNATALNRERKAQREQKRLEENAKKAEENVRKAEENARKKAEENARKKAEENAKKTEENARKAEENARKKAEENAKKTEENARKAEENARKKAEENAKKAEENAKKANENARKKVEENAKKAEENAKKKAEENAKKAEENARKKVEENAKKAEENAKKKAEENAKKKAEENAKKKAEENARKKAEENARKKAEENARKKAEENAKKAEENAKKAEENARKKAEENAKKKAEENAKKAEENARKKAEENAKKKAEENAKKKAEENAKKAEENARKKAEENARKKAEENAKKAEENTRKLKNSLKNIGLNTPNQNSIMKKFTNGNRNVNKLIEEAKELKKTRNSERKALEIKNIQNKIKQKRENNLRKLTLHLKNLNLTSNEKQSFYNNFNRNVNVNTLTNQANDLVKRKNNKARELAEELGRKKSNLGELLNTLTNLTPKERNGLIKRVVSANTNIEPIKAEAIRLNKVVKNKREAQNKIDEERRIEQAKKQRGKDEQRLDKHLRSLKHLTNEDMNEFMSSFRNETNSIENLITASKAKNADNEKDKNNVRNYVKQSEISQNKKAKYLKQLNVPHVNITPIRELVNANAEAEKMLEEQQIENRRANRDQLSSYLNEIGLNSGNAQTILNKFNANKSVTSTNARKEANKILVQRKYAANRNSLVEFMNTLNITNRNKTTILKNYDRQAANYQTLRNRASQINSAVKNKMVQRQELSNYFNNLGVNGTQLLKKFDNGRSTVESLKRDADKMKLASNAQLIKSKKESINEFMKQTRLSDANKRSFINRIQVNTNINSIKTEIQDLEASLKEVNDEIGRKRSELSEFLNTLDNLTPKNRNGLIKRVVGVNTNIEPIKLEGEMLNKSVKNKRAARNKIEEEKRMEQARKQRENDKKRLDKHLRGLKHLTSKDMEEFMSNFNNETNTIENLIAASKAKNTENEKDKNDVRNYVKQAVIPQNRKAIYLKQLNVPHVNITPIRGLVDANVISERNALQKTIKNAGNKIKKLTNITSEEQAAFKNRLQSEAVNVILKEAEKLNFNRKQARKNKNKTTKNVAESLRVLTTLTRENRKMFMNRVPTNGAQKVISNAFALDEERGKLIKAKENAAKAEEEAKKKAENNKKAANEARKAKNASTKNVANKLQKLTALERENRAAFMKRLPTNGANKVLANATALNTQRKTEREQKRLEEEAKKKAEEEAKKKAENNKKAANEARKAKNASTKNVANKLQKLTALERENRAAFMKRLPTNGANKVLANATALNTQRKTEREQKRLEEEAKKKAEEEAKKKAENNKKAANEARKAKNASTKNVANKLQKLTALERENRAAFMKRLPTNGANKVLANATALNTQRKTEREQKRLEQEAKKKAEEEARKKMEDDKKAANEARKAKNASTKNVASKLQKLTALERENRAAFMKRLPTNGANKVLANATALNTQRKTEREQKRLEEEAKKKADEEAKKKAIENKRLANEARKAKNTSTKNVANKLQKLTALERENRAAFMKRLPTNGANKVLANATALNTRRKTEREQKRLEEEARKAKNASTKNVAAKLQELTNLTRENRKMFMNRLPINGPEKVLANAREKDAITGRRIGIEWKLKKIGVRGSDLDGLLKRWDDSTDKTIWADARKIVAEQEEAKKTGARQPLLNKVIREIPGITGQWRRGWETAIRKAGTSEELQKIDRLLDEKASLRKEIETAPITEDKRRGQLRFVMQMTNDVGKRRQELAKDIKTKKNLGDSATKGTAQKLQSLNKLGRNNRKLFMNRITRGENARVVLKNAEKLQRNRITKERVETQRKDAEQKQAQQQIEIKRAQLKDQERQKANAEKARVAKLKVDEAEKRRLALQKSEAKRMQKEQQRKQNRTLAKAAGTSVKATQKKQQMIRRKK